MTNTTIDNSPEFWDWLIQKEEEEKIRKTNGNNDCFEPIPLYIELEKPTNSNRNESNSNESIIDYEVNQVVYKL